MKKDDPKFSVIKLRRKLLGVYLILILLVVISFAILFYSIFSHVAFNSIRTHAQSKAEAIAETIDFSGHDSLKFPSQVNSEVYARIFNNLNVIAEAQPDVAFIYTMRERSSGDWEFVVDATFPEDSNENGVIDEDEEVAGIGEFYDVSCCEQLPLALGGPTADMSVTSDVWGDWISGYAPITENGVVIGIVGVDISAEEYENDKRLLLGLTIVIVAITLILALFFVAIAYQVLKKESDSIQGGLKIRNAELEKNVTARTKELGAIIGFLSVELDQCINVIKGAIASNGVLAELEKVKIKIKQVSAMNSSFQLAANIRSGSFALKKQMSNFDLMAKFVFKDYDSAIKKRGIQFSTNIDRSVGVFSFDKIHIEQVLGYLLESSINNDTVKNITVNGVVDTRARMMKLQVITDAVQDKAKIGKDDVNSILKDIIISGVIEAHGGTFGKEVVGAQVVNWFQIPYDFST